MTFLMPVFLTLFFALPLAPCPRSLPVAALSPPALENLIVTGSTRTNVNDFCAIMVLPRSV